MVGERKRDREWELKREMENKGNEREGKRFFFFLGGGGYQDRLRKTEK